MAHPRAGPRTSGQRASLESPPIAIHGIVAPEQPSFPLFEIVLRSYAGRQTACGQINGCFRLSLLRIDVHTEAYSGVRSGRGDPLTGPPNRRHGRLPLSRLHDEHPALAVAQAKEGSRAEHRRPLAAEGLAQALTHGAGRRLGGSRVAGRAHDPDEMREGRVAERATALELAGKEAVA